MIRYSFLALAALSFLLYTASAFPMLVIRLQRTGRENTPTYRVVVSEKARSAKKGAHEILGHYLPAAKPAVFKCDAVRAEYWISKGAHPSNTVARLLKKDGMKNMEKFMVTYAKQKSKSAVPETPPAAPAAAAPAPEVKKEEAPKDEAPKEEVKKEEAPAAAAVPEAKKEEAPAA